jgi:hypothetical protein
MTYWAKDIAKWEKIGIKNDSISKTIKAENVLIN